MTGRIGVRVDWFRMGLGLLRMASGARAADYFMYAGTYTNKQSKGIYTWKFDPRTGKAVSMGLAVETTSPSFLAVHPNRRFLYAVNEVPNYKGEKSGSVSAFAIDRQSGKLTLLNTVPPPGAGPCPLPPAKKDRALLLTDYTAC